MICGFFMKKILSPEMTPNGLPRWWTLGMQLESALTPARPWTTPRILKCKVPLFHMSIRPCGLVPSRNRCCFEVLFGLLLVTAQPGGVLNGSLASTVMLTASDPPYVPSAGTFIAGSMMHECATTHGYSTTTIVS